MKTRAISIGIASCACLAAVFTAAHAGVSAKGGVKVGLKKMMGKFRKNQQKDKQAEQSGEQKVTMRTELVELTNGVQVLLPSACQEAYEKKMK